MPTRTIRKPTSKFQIRLARVSSLIRNLGTRDQLGIILRRKWRINLFFRVYVYRDQPVKTQTLNQLHRHSGISFGISFYIHVRVFVLSLIEDEKREETLIGIIKSRLECRIRASPNAHSPLPPLSHYRYSFADVRCFRANREDRNWINRIGYWTNRASRARRAHKQ